MSEIKDYPPYLDYPKPKRVETNADHIRSMTDEELAVFLDGLTGNCVDCESEDAHNTCPIHKLGFGRYCNPRDIMNWLKQPIRRADNGT